MNLTRVIVYVVDMNLTKALEEFEKIVSHLKMEFEMKDRGKTRLYLELKFKRCFDGILAYESNYTPKVLPFGYTYDLPTLYANKTLEEVMKSKVPYLSSTLRFVVLSLLH
ncbi:hypothetical protein ACFXTH_002983 [Malus domestica]